ncbi:MAG: cryptochrome/photolyase family protein [Gemmatimonadales bacterium]
MRTYFVGPWELSEATAYLPESPALGRVLVIESLAKGSALPFHKQKLVLVLSAMRHFVRELRARGFEVDHRVAATYADGIEAHIGEYRPSEVVIQEPAEWGVGESLRRLAETRVGRRARTARRAGGQAGGGARAAVRTVGAQHGGPDWWAAGIHRGPGSDTVEGGAPGTTIRILPDRRFLTSRDVFAAWARDHGGQDERAAPAVRMEQFYRWQRRRLGILLDGDRRPEGGRWNMDRENRQGARALLRHGLPPEPAAFAPDGITREVMRLVEEMSATDPHWGSLDSFDWPVTRAEALDTLRDFLAHRLAQFGPFQDAILEGEPWLFHSRLSAALNIGLLHPREVVDAVLEYHEEDGEVPLASIEGFIRQIIGWREYINGIYWLSTGWRESGAGSEDDGEKAGGPAYRRYNYFGHARALPQVFWEPERTDMACVRDAVGSVRDNGYAHHIQRLMVLGNFATLAGVHPQRLSEWFWAGFVDAMEWVELPNVVGMATYGDGGILASKPYVSSAAYIDRMSNHCKGCRFDPGRRTGKDACPFNFLYWTFLDDIRVKRLDVGARMGLMLANLEKIDRGELAAMRQARRAFLEGLAPDETGWTFNPDQG